jgi:glycosyltransferase involved in cell wall biosynthesis
MKILMLHNRYLVPGGEEQATETDVALLREHGHTVELLERDNNEIERMGMGQTTKNTLWASDSYHRIFDKLWGRDFDILHVQNFFPLWSPSVYHAAVRCGVPVVQTLHNYRLLCVISFLFRDGRPCEECVGRMLPWPGVLHGCYRDSRAGSAVVAGMIGFHKMLGTWRQKVRVYVAVSEFAREKYIAGGLPAEKIVVRPNCMHQLPPPGSGRGGYALYVGRLSPEKGIAGMLESWQSAENPLPLKIAGDGPLRKMVLAASEKSPGIEYMGHMSLPAVLELMGRAEFLVFPSQWYETMGRTIMEAFAVGTPVVATNIGAPASMVEHGKTGFHFPPGDVQALRGLVERCSRNLEEMRAMRTNARAAFEEKYTSAAGAASLLAIYRAAREGLLPKSKPEILKHGGNGGEKSEETEETKN